jgi:hypothetical protein
MNTATKLFTIALSFVLSFGIFFTGNTTATTSVKSNTTKFTDDFRRERVCIDGVWYIIVYGPDGGIVEVIIDNND